MIDLVSPLLGPLAIPECHRAARRPWPILARGLLGGLAALTAIIAFWTWFIQTQINPSHMPYSEFRVGLAIIEWLNVAVALVLAPAFLAGSIAGEKERGSIGLLLATDATPREIVLGRLAGGLGPVTLILLASVPILLGLAHLAGFSALCQLVLFVFPMAVAFGAGGVALGASVLSRRGRDALMLVYLLIALTQFAPLVDGLGILNPFVALGSLAWFEKSGAVLICSGVWLAAGLGGILLATWRLRPAALSEGESDRARKRLARRRRGRGVPDVDEVRPMLWKERYVERGGTLGGLGRWIGGGIGLGLVGAAVVFGGISFHNMWLGSTDSEAARSARLALIDWIDGTSFPLILLIWAAVGIRAAVTIASERERGTWEGLLTSPLEGREIIMGKLVGSLRAVRWLAAATVFAWVVAVAAHAMTLSDGGQNLVWLAVGSLVLAAIGVRVSLHCATGTRAMGVTLAVAMVVGTGIWIVAGSVCLFVAMALWLGWLLLGQFGVIDAANTSPWFPIPFEVGFLLACLVGALSVAILLVIETGLRFDRIAGRMTGGKASTALDRFFHGGPVRPVPVHLGRTSALILVDREPVGKLTHPGKPEVVETSLE